jgi:hypothetical protein
MAIQDTVRYAISVTPVEQVADVDGNNHDIIASEVGRSLGGSGTALVADFSATAAAQGYKDHTVNYLEALDSATTAISTEATATFVYIKNTGYTFSSATALGAALTASIQVMSGAVLLAVLDAGECFIMKDDNAGIVASSVTVKTVTTANGADAALGHLAVEYLVVD